MKVYAVILLGLVLAFPVGGADPPPINIPVTPVPPTPPTPVPTVVTKLNASQLFVMDSNSPWLITSSPQGIVEILEDLGPIKIKGVFVDGKGVVETRTFKGRFIYEIDAVATGHVEIIMIPSGATDPTWTKRIALDCTVGPPVPPTPTDPLTAAMKDALVGDSQPLTIAGQLATLYRQVASVTSQDPTITTYAALASAIKPKQDAILPVGTAPKFRAVLTGALGKLQGTTIDRALVASTFNQVAAALEGVK